MRQNNSHCDPNTCRRYDPCWDTPSSPSLHHNLLLTLAACNEREVRPQSLWNPIEAEDPEAVAIYSLYSFLI